jgi:hypothetical protein
MTYLFPKAVAGIFAAILAFGTLTGHPEAQSSQPATTVSVQQNLIQTTTITEPIMVIDPYASPAAQFAALAVNLGWPVSEYNQLVKIIDRESGGNPSAHNLSDPNGGSFGLMQINGFWCKGKSSYLQTNGILTSCKMLLDPQVNLRAGLVIWNRSGWNPWGTK